MPGLRVRVVSALGDRVDVHGERGDATLPRGVAAKVYVSA
jgi:hypothetical protein